MSAPPDIDVDAMLCALVIAPQTWSRNRFFSLYEREHMRRVRRRAGRIRGVIRQLCGKGPSRAEIVGEQILNDGSVVLRYRVHDLAYERTAAFSAIEAAALRYALHRAGMGPLADEDRALVESALSRLTADLELARPA